MLLTTPRPSVTRVPAPVPDTRWTTDRESDNVSDMAFDRIGNLWAVGSGAVVQRRRILEAIPDVRVVAVSD